MYHQIHQTCWKITRFPNREGQEESWDSIGESMIHFLCAHTDISLQIDRVGGAEKGYETRHTLLLRSKGLPEEHREMAGMLDKVLNSLGVLMEEAEPVLPAPDNPCFLLTRKPARIARGGLPDYPLLQKADREAFYRLLEGSGITFSLLLTPFSYGYLQESMDAHFRLDSPYWRELDREKNLPKVSAYLLVHGPASRAGAYADRIGSLFYPCYYKDNISGPFRAAAWEELPWAMAAFARKSRPFFLFEEAKSLLQFPVKDTPGIRLNYHRSQSSLESDPLRQETDAFYVGRSFAGIRFYLPLARLAQHCITVGMSGSGKTYLAERILEYAARNNIQVTIFEHCKRENHDRIPNLTAYRDAPSIARNLFRIPRGLCLQDYLPLLTDLIIGSITVDEPFPSLLPRILKDVYFLHGYTMASDEGSPGIEPFDYRDVIHYYNAFVKKLGYGKEVQLNLGTAGRVRLESLFDSSALNVSQGLEAADLVARNTIIDVTSGFSSSSKLITILSMLTSMMEIIRKSRTAVNEGIRNLIFLDELHELLPGADTGSSENERKQYAILRKMLYSLLTTARAYGVGIFLADQSPLILGDFLPQAKTVFAFNLLGQPAQTVSEWALGGQDLVNGLAHLKTGEAYFLSGDTREAVRIAPAAQTDPLVPAILPAPPVPYRECACSKCDPGARDLGEMLSSRMLTLYFLNHEEGIRQEAIPSILGSIGYFIEKAGRDPRDAHLHTCVRTHLKRALYSRGFKVR